MIYNHFINSIKLQENNNFYEQMMKSITNILIQLIKEHKPISNEMLIMILNLKNENSQLLFDKLIEIISEILNPLNFDEIKWSWFDEYLSQSSIWFVTNNKNELFYSLIQNVVQKYEKEILGVKMKNDILDSKIMDEKEEWSFIMNNNN